MKNILNRSLLCLGLLALPVLADGDNSLIQLPLQNTGMDADAIGTLEINLKEQSSTMKLNLTNLTPGAAYIVTNGATPEAEFRADAKGAARLLFTTNPKKGLLALDFEPRGQILGVWTGGVRILQAVVSAQGEPPKSTVSESVVLTKPGSRSKAVARFSARPTGQQSFTVQLSQISGTGWSLYVDGVWRGSFVVKGSSASLDFHSHPSSPATRWLDFDPRGRTLDIVQGNQLMFSGLMAAKAAEVNVATHAWLCGGIPTTGQDSDGSARVKLVVESDARRKFMLWLMDVPEGAYEFMVNGVPVAQIQAEATGEGVIGILEFSSRNDDSDELPLTFDPSTAVFTIRKTGVDYFHGRLVIASGGKDTDKEPDPDSIKEDLVSTGFDPNAKGTVEFKRKKSGDATFRIDTKNASLGTFTVWVGGIERGTFKAEVTYNQGYGSRGSSKKEIKGSIDFETDRRKNPLDFDPRGQLVEIGEVGETTAILFSQIFGATRGPARPVICRLPLFSRGTVPGAIAKMEFKRDEQGVKLFKVSLESALPGTYALLIGGKQHALIQVPNTAGGSGGVIEFDDIPSAGQHLLDFDPRGAAISIVRDGEVCFERSLPAGL